MPFAISAARLKRWFQDRRRRVTSWKIKEVRQMVRGLGLWMLGVPITVIVLIALFTNFI